MAGLQRSAVSFRRQGSSGSVWDDKFLAQLQLAAAQQKEEDNNNNNNNKSPQKEEIKQDATSTAAAVPVPAGLTIPRSRSNGGRGFRTGRVSPAIEPPSPKVSACGLCSAFGKKTKTRRRPPKSGKRVM